MVQFRLSHTLRGHSRGVLSLAYHRDYHCLVSAGYDHRAKIWDPYVDKSICSLNGHFNPLISVNVVDGTPQIITADVTGAIKIWDIRNYACVQTFNIRTSEAAGSDLNNLDSVLSLSVIPNRKRILVGGAGGVITFDGYWRFLASAMTLSFIGAGLSAAGRNPLIADVEQTVISLYNDHFVSIVTAVGKSLKVWDALTGVLRSTYRDVCESVITALAFDNSLKKILVGDANGSIRVLNGLNGRQLKICNVNHEGSISSLDYVPSMKAVISGSWDALSRLYDDSTSDSDYVHLRREIRHHKSDLTCACTSNLFTLTASGSCSGSLALWDFDANTIEADLIGHKSEITALIFLDPYPLLISADRDANLCFWPVRPIISASIGSQSRCLLRIVNQVDGRNQPILAMKFIPGQSLLYSGDCSGVCRVWSLGGVLHRLRIAPFDSEPSMGRLEAYETYRASNRSMITKLLNQASLNELLLPSDLQLVQSWRAHTDSIRHLDLVQSEGLAMGVITTSYDRMVKVWSLRGRLLGSLHQGRGLSQSTTSSLSLHPWLFQIDLRPRQERAQQQARDLLREIAASY